MSNPLKEFVLDSTRDGAISLTHNLCWQTVGYTERACPNLEDAIKELTALAEGHTCDE